MKKPALLAGGQGSRIPALLCENRNSFNTLKTAVPRKRHGGFLKKADYLANTFLSLAKRGRPSTFSSFVSP